jgi:hypothetical protein
MVGHLTLCSGVNVSGIVVGALRQKGRAKVVTGQVTGMVLVLFILFLLVVLQANVTIV